MLTHVPLVFRDLQKQLFQGFSANPCRLFSVETAVSHHLNLKCSACCFKTRMTKKGHIYATWLYLWFDDMSMAIYWTKRLLTARCNTSPG